MSKSPKHVGLAAVEVGTPNMSELAETFRMFLMQLDAMQAAVLASNATVERASLRSIMCPPQLFDGVNVAPRTWLCQMENYLFDVNDTETRLRYVCSYLRGFALAWHCDVALGVDRPREGWTWASYCTAFQNQFDPLGESERYIESEQRFAFAQAQLNNAQARRGRRNRRQ